MQLNCCKTIIRYKYSNVLKTKKLHELITLQYNTVKQGDGLLLDPGWQSWPVEHVPSPGTYSTLWRDHEVFLSSKTKSSKRLKTIIFIESYSKGWQKWNLYLKHLTKVEKQLWYLRNVLLWFIIVCWLLIMFVFQYPWFQNVRVQLSTEKLF